MRIGDIYYVKFPYQEDKSIKKDRPAVLIVSSRKDSDSVIALKITTTDNKSPYNIKITDPLSAGLRKTSFVQCNRIEEIPKTDIVPLASSEQGYFGSLCSDDLKNVQKAFEKYLERLNSINESLECISIIREEQEEEACEYWAETNDENELFQWHGRGR